MNFSFKIRPKILIIISLVVSILLVVSAFLELSQSKGEIYHLLSEQAATLSETIVSSSLNALNSSNEIEALIVHRLLNNAKLIKRLDSLNVLTNEKLVQIGKENDLFRINIFNNKGDRVFTNRVIEKEDHIHGEEKVNRYKEVERILTGKSSELIIGLKKAMHVDEKRFAVAVPRSEKRGAIVVNLNATDFLQFRKRIGIETIISEIGNNAGFKYIALQDSNGIIAASKNADNLSSFSDDLFLHQSAAKDSIQTRLITYKNETIFEAVRSNYLENEFAGIFRIGISLDEIKSVESRMIRRVIIISIILATIGIILLSILFTNQNLKILSTEFGNYKTFTNSFLQKMKESVIIITSDNIVTLFNSSSEVLYGISKKEVLGKKLEELNFKGIQFIRNLLLESNESYRNLEVHVFTATGEKYLSVIINPNYNLSKGLESNTLILNDITDSKIMEEQAKRNEKLIAMGELASGVAHEIRNPINSIGMIAQRLSREFKPEIEVEEYQLITALLKSEVDRINKIITQFLKYAKPLDMSVSRVNVNKFMKEIYHLFTDQTKHRNITFLVKGVEQLFAMIDPELVKQAIINIIQNAFEAVENFGKIIVEYFRVKDNLEILVSDDGKGIEKKDQSKLFDLYYTTKKEGNGLGLSISQKIISQHNGIIDFTTGDKGTTFKITLPLL